jgi:dihydrofolate synthase/folylpolyglutamate synthase
VSRIAAQGQIRSAEDAAAWLRGLIDVEKRPEWPYRRFSLDPIRALLARLGHPELRVPALHIAGSKGKGSTALLAEAILCGAGRRVGTFTSPHLERWTERFRVCGAEVEGERLARAVEAVRPHVESLRGEDPAAAPTFFDATTAVAFELFRSAGVDCAILEVGLGGRLDSTNACAPAVTCVTSIELEHTDRLGGTLGEIAGEKAGILKTRVPAVVGALPEPALEVVLRRAAEVGARVARFGRDFGSERVDEDLDGSWIRVWDGPLEAKLRLPLLGAPCAHNAALATACARRLLGDAFPTGALAEVLAASLARVALPARIEVVSRRPFAIVDAAHTAASARALADALAALPRARLHLVLSVSAGKDLDAILAALLPHCDALTATRAEPTRSLAPAEVAAAVRALAPGLSLRVVPNPQLALRAAHAELAPEDCLCAAGSVYLAGIARRVLARPRPAADVAVTRGRGPLLA